LNKIKSGKLPARQTDGRNSAWLIDEHALELHLQEVGSQAGLRRTSNTALEARVAVLEQAVGRITPGSPDRDLDWADLRAQVVALQETLMRTQAATDLQEQAVNQRAIVGEHLAAAIAAAQRTDALQRQAIAQLHEALGSLARPGHAGGLADEV